FVPKLRTNPLIVVAAVLAIVGIFCKRVQLLVGGFQIPNLDMPAVVSGPGLTDAGAALQSAGGAMVYFPSPLEFGVMVGVVGLGALLLLLGLKFLPLKPTEQSH
ncbi:polysulfide reductase, partial [Eggerthella sp. HF-4214]|nr:polysulfide reductase [Eggerthella guodeyinii]